MFIFSAFVIGVRDVAGYFRDEDTVSVSWCHLVAMTLTNVLASNKY